MDLPRGGVSSWRGATSCESGGKGLVTRGEDAFDRSFIVFRGWEGGTLGDGAAERRGGVAGGPLGDACVGRLNEKPLESCCGEDCAE